MLVLFHPSTTKAWEQESENSNWRSMGVWDFSASHLACGHPVWSVTLLNLTMLKSCSRDSQKILGGNQRECHTAVVAKQVLVGLLLLFLFSVNHMSSWSAYEYLKWEIYDRNFEFLFNLMVSQLVWLQIYELFTQHRKKSYSVYPAAASACLNSLLFNAAINKCLDCTSVPHLWDVVNHVRCNWNPFCECRR